MTPSHGVTFLRFLLRVSRSVSVKTSRWGTFSGPPFKTKQRVKMRLFVNVTPVSDNRFHSKAAEPSPDSSAPLASFFLSSNCLHTDTFLYLIQPPSSPDSHAAPKVNPRSKCTNLHVKNSQEDVRQRDAPPVTKGFTELICIQGCTQRMHRFKPLCFDLWFFWWF